MRCALRLLIVAAALLPACSALSGVFGTYEANNGYAGDTFPWGLTFAMKGFAPEEGAAAGLPVFLWFDGTGDSYDTPAAHEFTQAMASRGFLAVSVEYPNPTMEILFEAYKFGLGSTLGLPGYSMYPDEWMMLKASKIVSAAIDGACAMAGADCAAGVALSGFSQGAYLSFWGGGSDDRVTAILPYGMGCGDDTQVHLEGLRQHRIRLAPAPAMFITGGADALTGNGDPFDLKTCLTSLAGIDEVTECEGDVCTGANGNKVALIPGGVHSVLTTHEPAVGDVGMKCAVRDGTEAWGLQPAMDWLATTASPAKATASSLEYAPCDTSVDTPVDLTPQVEMEYAENNLLTALLATGNHNTLATILTMEPFAEILGPFVVAAHYAGVDARTSVLPFTFFAPTDEALAAFTQETLGIAPELLLLGASADEDTMWTVVYLIMHHMVANFIPQSLVEYPIQSLPADGMVYPLPAIYGTQSVIMNGVVGYSGGGMAKITGHPTMEESTVIRTDDGAVVSIESVLPPPGMDGAGADGDIVAAQHEECVTLLRFECGIDITDDGDDDGSDAIEDVAQTSKMCTDRCQIAMTGDACMTMFNGVPEMAEQFNTMMASPEMTFVCDCLAKGDVMDICEVDDIDACCEAWNAEPHCVSGDASFDKELVAIQSICDAGAAPTEAPAAPTEAPQGTSGVGAPANSSGARPLASLVAGLLALALALARV